MRSLALLTAFGCAGAAPPSPDTAAQPTLATPSLVASSLRCDVDDASWVLTAEADAWTGGGTTAWTVDGSYVEIHKVGTTESAADGSWEELLLELKIVSDWREAQSGSKTDFTCASDPNVVFVLYDAEGKRADCRGWGPDPSVWETVEGVSACE